MLLIFNLIIGQRLLIKTFNAEIFKRTNTDVTAENIDFILKILCTASVVIASGQGTFHNKVFVGNRG